jgi:hypothetical protein
MLKLNNYLNSVLLLMTGLLLPTLHVCVCIYIYSYDLAFESVGFIWGLKL